MMRLDMPIRQLPETIDACAAGIVRLVALRDRLLQSRDLLNEAGNLYFEYAQNAELYELLPIIRLTPEDEIVGQLSHIDLNNLYENYLARREKPGRTIYDSIMAAARGDCPYCGGIGKNTTLDHYLSQAVFSQFSILPMNLIPACRDCNLGEKKNYTATRAEHQIIHPYFDHQRFFVDPWVEGTYHMPADGRPARCEYFVAELPAWNRVDIDRAKSHFKLFNLATKYETQADTALQTLDNQIERLQAQGLDNITIVDTLMHSDVTRQNFINHWLPTLHRARARALLNIQEQ